MLKVATDMRKEPPDTSTRPWARFASRSRKAHHHESLVSGGALILASAAFFVYDVITLRASLIRNAWIEAQIVGCNAVSPLIFNDPKSGESSLSA